CDQVLPPRHLRVRRSEQGARRCLQDRDRAREERRPATREAGIRRVHQALSLLDSGRIGEAGARANQVLDSGFETLIDPLAAACCVPPDSVIVAFPWPKKPNPAPHCWPRKSMRARFLS